LGFSCGFFVGGYQNIDATYGDAWRFDAQESGKPNSSVTGTLSY